MGSKRQSAVSSDYGWGESEKSLTEQKPVLATTTLSELEFYVEINVQQKIGGYCIIARDLTSLTQEIANEEKVAKFNNEKTYNYTY